MSLTIRFSLNDDKPAQDDSFATRLLTVGAALLATPAVADAISNLLGLNRQPEMQPIPCPRPASPAVADALNRMLGWQPDDATLVREEADDANLETCVGPNAQAAKIIVPDEWNRSHAKGVAQSILNEGVRVVVPPDLYANYCAWVKAEMNRNGYGPKIEVPQADGAAGPK